MVVRQLPLWLSCIAVSVARKNHVNGDFFCVCHKNVVPLHGKRIKRLLKYEEDTIISNTPVPFFGDNTRIGAVCADSGGDEAGALRVCDGDV